MSATATPDDSPCTACGACCAYFRVSFYWAEAEQNGLAAELVEALTPMYSCMAGTNAATPRCAALSGTIGEAVACTVYPQRTSPCRELQPGDDKCNRARAKHGLPPIAA